MTFTSCPGAVFYSPGCGFGSPEDWHDGTLWAVHGVISSDRSGTAGSLFVSAHCGSQFFLDCGWILNAFQPARDPSQPLHLAALCSSQVALLILPGARFNLVPMVMSVEALQCTFAVRSLFPGLLNDLQNLAQNHSYSINSV